MTSLAEKRMCATGHVSQSQLTIEPPRAVLNSLEIGALWSKWFLAFSKISCRTYTNAEITKQVLSEYLYPLTLSISVIKTVD